MATKTLLKAAVTVTGVLATGTAVGALLKPHHPDVLGLVDYLTVSAVALSFLPIDEPAKRKRDLMGIVLWAATAVYATVLVAQQPTPAAMAGIVAVLVAVRYLPGSRRLW